MDSIEFASPAVLAFLAKRELNGRAHPSSHPHQTLKSVLRDPGSSRYSAHPSLPPDQPWVLADVQKFTSVSLQVGVSRPQNNDGSRGNFLICRKLGSPWPL